MFSNLIINKAFIVDLAGKYIANHKNKAEKEFIKAINKNKTDLAQAFIEGGIDVNNARNKYGSTALMIAIWRGNEDLVKMLLDKGVNP